MNSLWAILIDISGSMGQPFAVSAATSTFKGLVEEGAYQTKLDAAKEMVLKQLHGLSDTDVAIIPFADEAHVAFKGTAEEVKNADHAIRTLAPGGGTNLASALLLALHRVATSSPYRVISFLVISDGLSNVGDPVQAAEECVQSGLPIRIGTILIDPTQKVNASHARFQ